MKPKLAVSGYRGIWGESLTEEIARTYVRAFALFVQKRGGSKVIIGRDGRESGPMIMEAVINEITSLGLNVIDLGMMPTPVVLFLTRSEQADGAIIITASHNPIEYNGLKFATASGAFTNEAEVAEITALYGLDVPKSVYPGTRTRANNLFAKYLTTILSSVDVEAIKACNFKVAIDPINSVGCTTTPLLLAELGATTVAINGEATGRFTHEPEPIAKNLTALQALVRENGAQIGFAQDPDGDRLVICDEHGNLLSEEMTLPLCLKSVLAKTSGDIVINLSTSNVSEDIATSFGGKTIRSKVGEANVVQAIRENNAIIGGEGSSGPIWPAVNGTRDSFVSMALILELMAQEHKSISELAQSLPEYTMVKEKIQYSGDLSALYPQIQVLFPEATANTLDGLRLDFTNRSWLHIRPSNTEPILRIFAEGSNSEETHNLVSKTLTFIQNTIV